MCLNGGIFQAHCVNFEIKKKQIATPVISDYFCIYRYIFPVNSNSDFASAQAELGFFFQWCIDSGMQLSLSFTRSRFTRHFQYELAGPRLKA
jgi:hypothetical protein